MKFIKTILLLSLTLFLVACNQQNTSASEDDSLADRSFITGEPCAAPCWHNLVVGKTTEQETLETVKQLPFIAPNSPREGTTVYDGEEAKVFVFECLSQSGGISSCVILDFSQNELKKIYIAVAYELTFKMAVEELGPPDYVSYFVQPGHEIACDTSLIWQTIGISVYQYQKQACPARREIDLGKKVDPGTRVTNILYYIPSDYSNVCGSCDPWLGFDEP
jgi:hypothetical protein